MIIIESYDNSKKELAVLLSESVNVKGAAKQVVKFLLSLLGKIIETISKALTWIAGQLIKGFVILKEKLTKFLKNYNVERVRTVTFNKSYTYKTDRIPNLEYFRGLKVSKLSLESNLHDAEEALEELRTVRVSNSSGRSEEVEMKYSYKDSYDFINHGDSFIKEIKTQLEKIITHLKGVEREIAKYSYTPEGEQDPNAYEEYRATLQSIKTLSNAKIKVLDLIKTAAMDHMSATILAKDEEIKKAKNSKKKLF